MYRLLYAGALFLLFSCGGDIASKQAAPVPSKTATATIQGQPLLPRIPNDLRLKMWNEGEIIDYIFHDLPFSMNQNEQASIRTNITYIGDKPVTVLPKGCKPMARQFYQANGVIVYEADVYFDDNCQFYVFYVDGQAKYANQMDETGKQFFTNMITQAMQARQKIGGTPPAGAQ